MKSQCLTYCFLLLFLSVAWVEAQAQNRITTEEYIETFRDVAIQKMKEYHIPASITLAQGILESGSGNSKLAQKANNHFGIKCHQGWDGKTYYMDDDEKHECFRKYKDASDSYSDHSLFLTQRGRYSFLFDYEITDYEKWAHGLKKAGYATNPKYPQLLIGIIERYNLAQYDTGVKISRRDRQIAAESNTPGTEQTGTIAASTAPLLENLSPISVSEYGRNIYENNNIKFIRARAGDDYYSLADEFDIYSWQLFKYNDTDKPYTPQANEIVYLEKKKRKAGREHKTHVVQQGENLVVISQLYGIRLKRLMKMNELESEKYVPAGKVLKLR